MKEYFYNLITGRRRVFIGPILRPFLLLASFLFYICVETRVVLYRTGILKQGKLPVPVISIGNITWGGTGKTPLAETILRWLSSKSINPVLLIRGYGKDEDRMILSNIGHIKVLSGKRRLLNALDYLREHKADIFVLDDGFQHLKIKRDIDIVTLDAQSPFGNNKIIPAGWLREPVSALKRADIVVITKSDLVEKQQISDIVSLVKDISNNVMIVKAVHRPKFFHTGIGQKRHLEYLKGKKVISVSALADNSSFIKTIENLGADVVFSPFYMDHHAYTKSDVKMIVKVLGEFHANTVVTTEKDWVKLMPLTSDAVNKGTEFLILKIELEIDEYEIFYRRLSAILPC
jgi:tetraacyldisaccharide 4'-kinase